mmetsp:Transcript_23647/g.76983  ORF Transcript_23647/g.76983 Transcript_23647/m.76983 type:complete len:222 (+) Transcript_23647:2290-2955(+)
MPPDWIGSPDTQQRLLQRSKNLRPLERRELRGSIWPAAVMELKKLRNRCMLGQDTSSSSLSGMGCEHKFCVLSKQRLSDLFRSEAFLHELLEAILQSLGRGGFHSLVATLVLSPPAHSMIPLNKIGMLQHLQEQSASNLYVRSTHVQNFLMHRLEVLLCRILLVHETDLEELLHALWDSGDALQVILQLLVRLPVHCLVCLFSPQRLKEQCAQELDVRGQD